MSFDIVADAQRYNLYVGRIATLSSGGAGSGTYDHGDAAPAGPFCDAATQAAGAGRLKIVIPAAQAPPEDAYVLVTAHVDDVESPAGRDSQAVEIARSQSICR